MFTTNLSCKSAFSQKFHCETKCHTFTTLYRIVLLYIILLAVTSVAAGEVCGGIRNRFICDEQDPSVFHICLGNNQYTMVCPGTLHFNLRTQNCDWPKSVNCVQEALSRQPYSNANTVPTLSPTSGTNQRLLAHRRDDSASRTKVLHSTSNPKSTTSPVSSVVHTINSSKVLAQETVSTEAPHSRYRLKVVTSTDKPLESLLPADEKVIEEVKKLSEELKHIDNYLKSLEPEEVGFMIEPYMAALSQKRPPYAQRYPKLESKKYTASPFNSYRRNSVQPTSPFRKSTSPSPYRINTATYYRSKSTNNPRTHRVSRMASTTRRTNSPFQPTKTLYRTDYIPSAYRQQEAPIPASRYSYKFAKNGFHNKSMGHIRNPYKDSNMIIEAYKTHGSKYNLPASNKQYTVSFGKSEHRFGDRITPRLTQRTMAPHPFTTRLSSNNNVYRNQGYRKPQTSLDIRTTQKSQMTHVNKATNGPQMSYSNKSTRRSQWLNDNGTTRKSQMPFDNKPTRQLQGSQDKTTRKFSTQNDNRITRFQSAGGTYKQPSIYKSTPTQSRKSSSYLSQARSRSMNRQGTATQARDGSLSIDGTTTQTREAPINKHGTTTQRRDAPFNKHGTTTQTREAPITKHGTTTQRRDAPFNKHGTTTQTREAPINKHGTTTQRRDAPFNKHGTTTQTRDAPINKHTTKTKTRDGFVNRHSTPTYSRDSTASRYKTSTQERNAQISRHNTLTSKQSSSNHAWWSTTKPSSSSASPTSHRMSKTTTKTSPSRYSYKIETSRKPTDRNLFTTAKSSPATSWWSSTKLDHTPDNHRDKVGTKSVHSGSRKYKQRHFPPRPNYNTRTPNFDFVPEPGNERSTSYSSHFAQKEQKARPINAPASLERSFTLHSAPQGEGRSFSLYQVNAPASVDRFALHKPNTGMNVQHDQIFALHKPQAGLGKKEMVMQTDKIVPSDKYEEEQKEQVISAYKSPVEKYETKKGKCSSTWCKLPDCRCIGSDIPGEYEATEIPQMVMLTFDDSINGQNMHYFRGIFNGTIKNPNGCPIKSTFFVSGDSSDYNMVKQIYKQGHEIASHTMSHRNPTTWWAYAGYENWEHEIVGMRDRLNEKSGVPVKEIIGMRAPFLQIGGDAQYAMLKENKFRYDSSMVTGNLYTNKKKPIWPFTLDTPPDSTTCSLTPCPTRSYPGLWEVPLIRWYGSNRVACAMPDACTIGLGIQGTQKFLEDNFNRHYTTNRAPFGIFIHASWFGRKNGNLEGMIEFLRSLAEKEDVWVVTVNQALDWIQHPVRLSALNSIQSWAC